MLPPTILISSRLLLAIDALLCIGIVFFTQYTEIDWKAYMQQVEGFLNGEFVYTNLSGDTGPLVYPAGFLYVYSGLYYLTERGRNILLAQGYFIVIYLFMVAFILRIYNSCKVPFWLCFALILSKRIHSIFMLRMFNDCISMFFLYVAITLFINRRWSFGSIIFSLAVSVKMNIFLFAPGLLTIYLTQLGVLGTIFQLFICALVQLALGGIFLVTDYQAYISKAFELSRVFDYRWTVNFKFLPVDIFVSPLFGHVLLVVMIICWIIVAKKRWIPRLKRILDYDNPTITADEQCSAIVQTLFESNIIGFVFCRSMHYQFYVWVFHQVPLVVDKSLDRRIPLIVKLVILVTLEMAFNIYPATPLSSALLYVCALLPLLCGILICSDVYTIDRIIEQRVKEIQTRRTAEQVIGEKRLKKQ
eukprot:Tbor_TRINITY_DN3985_c0_g1::TRINITY_DN3985_c0_g1_i1::g.819::m.819/K03845/ALG3; alpha-1,3-mannosyltransferase